MGGETAAVDKDATCCLHPRETVSELLERVRPKFGRILAKSSIPPADAEDLIQDTVLSWIQKQHDIRDPEAWLVAGLRFRCLVYWRGRRRCLYRAVDEVILEEFSEPSPPSTREVDLSHDLQKLLGQISGRCRSLLDLRYKWGLRPPEVAERLGYRRSSISNITRRCLTALTRELIAVGYQGSSSHVSTSER